MAKAASTPQHGPASLTRPPVRPRDPTAVLSSLLNRLFCFRLPVSPGSETDTMQSSSAAHEAIPATTAILRLLATGDPNNTFNSDEPKISIPGEDTPEKRELEDELRALVNRVRKLEGRAASTNGQTFPETPNELAGPMSPFSLAARQASPVPGLTGLRSTSPGSDESDQSQLEYLQQKCKAHEEEIRENRLVLENLLQETRSIENTPKVPIQEVSKVDRLQRELKKSQQANEAFSKALREIGEIVTAGMSSSLLYLAWY